MKNWVELVYFLKNQYEPIAKGSIINLDGEHYRVKRIDQVILLNPSIHGEQAIQIKARGIKI